MTNKQKIMKLCLFSLCLTLCAVCFIMIWYKDTNLWEFTWFFLGLVFLILCVPALKYPKIDYNKICKQIDETIKANPIPLDKVNEMYRYYGLENVKLKILRLFFNEDYTKRCVFYQQSNGVCVKFEDINYYNDETKRYRLQFAGWEQESNGTVDFFADSDIAYRETKNSLEGFYEQKLVFNKKHICYSKIIWKKWEISSKELPFGEMVLLDMKGNGLEFKDVNISVNYWYSEFYCSAYVYINSYYEFDYDKKRKFSLYKDGKKVGVILFNK